MDLRQLIPRVFLENYIFFVYTNEMSQNYPRSVKI